MQCETCGDAVSLSTAHRENGNFVCPDCHDDGQQQKHQAQKRRRQAHEQAAPQQQGSSAASKTQTAPRRDNDPVGSPTRSLQTPRTRTGRHEPTPPSDQPTGGRFKTLLSISKFISGVGWVLVGLGVLLAVVGLFGGGTFDQGLMGFLVGLAAGLYVSVSGLMMVASGQLFSCFVAIERNTRSVSELLDAREA